MTCTAKLAPPSWTSSSPVAGSHATTYWPSDLGGVQISHGPPSETLAPVGTLALPRRVLRSVVVVVTSVTSLGVLTAFTSRSVRWIRMPLKTVWPVARNASSGKLGYS
jgi:hypothetical protein